MNTDDARFLFICLIAAAVIVLIIRDDLREKAIERRAAIEMPTVMATPIADRRRRIAAEFDHDLANIRDLPETDHRETP